MELRRRLYTVVILLAVVIVGLLLLVWFAGTQPIGPNATQPPPQLSQSAGDAGQVLQTWINGNWAEDGAVVACNLVISKRESAQSHWTFQSYSTATNRLLVAVVQDQSVKVLRNITPLYRQSVLPQTAWKQDSQDILKIWWRAGGAAAWNKPEAQSLALRLGLREDNVPSWQLTLSTDDLSPLEFWEIRSDTGELLEHSSAGGQQ